MNSILWVHIAAGLAALPLGAVAVAARKGGPVHIRSGAWFAVAMLILGVTAAMLEPYRTPPGSPVAGIMVCYFVATGYVTGRRRDGSTSWFEIVACTFAFGFAAAMAWGGFTGSTTPAGPGPIFILAALCLIAGFGDLKAVMLKKLSAAQRISRHLWRMCFAFFIATGSFFLGQQDVLPQAVRGSPILFALAFAPLVIMLFWLVRIRFAKTVGRLTLRLPSPTPAVAAAPRLEMEI